MSPRTIFFRSTYAGLNNEHKPFQYIPLTNHNKFWSKWPEKTTINNVENEFFLIAFRYEKQTVKVFYYSRVAFILFSNKLYRSLGESRTCFVRNSWKVSSLGLKVVWLPPSTITFFTNFLVSCFVVKDVFDISTNTIWEVCVNYILTFLRSILKQDHRLFTRNCQKYSRGKYREPQMLDNFNKTGEPVFKEDNQNLKRYKIASPNYRTGWFSRKGIVKDNSYEKM